MNAYAACRNNLITVSDSESFHIPPPADAWLISNLSVLVVLPIYGHS